MNNFFDYDTAKAVYYVYLYGGISRAGDKINLTQSAMSRRIQMAEERSGIMIFDRRFHELRPTEEGITYIEACKKILHIGDATLKDAHAVAKQGCQRIRIISTPSLANLLLPTLFIGFEERHPDIEISIEESHDVMDVLDTDVIIGPYIPEQEELKQELLMSEPEQLYASEAYISKFGEPKTLAELEKHKLLTVNPRKYAGLRDVNWILTTGIGNSQHRRRSHLEFSSNNGKVEAMVAGLGIGSCTRLHLSLINNPRVKEILPGVTREPMKIYFIRNALSVKQKNLDIIYAFFAEGMKKLKTCIDSKTCESVNG